MSELDDPYRTVGETIRAARRELGMTLENLEAASGLRASFIGQIERRVKKGSVTSLARIAAGLGVPLHTLFNGGKGNNNGHAHARLQALLRGHTAHERELLLSTVRHLSRRLRALRRAR